MALSMKARLVLVVVPEPLGPGVIVLKEEESRVILIEFLVIVNSCLLYSGISDCSGSVDGIDYSRLD